MSADDPYLYPDVPAVLRNKFGIKNAAALDAAERVHVAQRIEEGVPTGAFDIAHLKAIQLHLFQDVYAWAGEIRTVELAKGGHGFQPVAYIPTGLANVHERLVRRRFLVGLKRSAFAGEAAQVIGDLNYVHPFREGNGRTQLQYLKLLCDRAGHDIDLARLSRSKWQEASRAAHLTDYELMSKAIAGALRRGQSDAGPT